jgi:hypothetical protein
MPDLPAGRHSSFRGGEVQQGFLLVDTQQDFLLVDAEQGFSLVEG